MRVYMICAVVFPLLGFAGGIVLLTKNRASQGAAVILVSLVATVVWAVVLASV